MTNGELKQEMEERKVWNQILRKVGKRSRDAGKEMEQDMEEWKLNTDGENKRQKKVNGAIDGEKATE